MDKRTMKWVNELPHASQLPHKHQVPRQLLEKNRAPPSLDRSFSLLVRKTLEMLLDTIRHVSSGEQAKYGSDVFEFG